MWSMDSDIKGGMAKGIWKQDSEANIWTQEGCEWSVEIHSLYHSANIVSGWFNHVAQIKKIGVLSIFLQVNLQEKTFRRDEENIRMDHKELEVSMRNLVVSAQDRDYWRVLVNTALNLQVP